MKNVFLFISLIIAFVTVQKVNSQSSVILAAKEPGLDPLLHNGKIYAPMFSKTTDGNPFYSGDEFVVGSVCLRGVHYNNLLLKYDIFNQQLVFQYQTVAGGISRIIISDAWLESFSLEKAYFEIINTGDSSKKIYQVLGNDSIKVLYHWNKRLELDSRHGATNFVFTKPLRNSYLFHQSKFLKFKNNRQFIRFFRPQYQNEIKKYLRQKKLNLKKISDQQMTELLLFCNSKVRS